MKIEEEIPQKEFRNACQKAAVNLLFISLQMSEIHAHFFKRHETAHRQFNALILHGQHPAPLSVSVIKGENCPNARLFFHKKKLFLIL